MGLKIVNARKGENPFKSYEGKYVILYEDPGYRLHFTFWDEQEQAIPYFSSLVEAQAALASHQADWTKFGPYNPSVHPYEALKEFEDHFHHPHWDFTVTALYFGRTEEIEQLAQGRRLLTKAAVEKIRREMEFLSTLEVVKRMKGETGV